MKLFSQQNGSAADWRDATTIIAPFLVNRACVEGGAAVRLEPVLACFVFARVIPSVDECTGITIVITSTNPRTRRSSEYHLCVQLYAEKFYLQPNAM